RNEFGIRNRNQSSHNCVFYIFEKLGNDRSAKAELGGPMICMYLLGNPDHYTSHKFIPFYWQTFVNEAKRAFDPEHDEKYAKVVLGKRRGKVVGLTPVQDYIYRSDELEHVSLYEFIRCYERLHIAGKNKRKRPDNTDETNTGHSEDDDDGHTSKEDISISTEAFSDISNEDQLDEEMENLPKDTPALKLPKNAYRFKIKHPNYDTKAMKFVKRNEMRVPNFLGSHLPRKDQGDQEHYCATMLCLFKPWRSGFDLKKADDLWTNAFNNHKFDMNERTLMNHFNIRYECMDSRDDHQAQMKKEAGGNPFNNWIPDNEGAEMINEDCHAIDGGIGVSEGKGLLEFCQAYLSKLNQMNKVKTTLEGMDWCTPLRRSQPLLDENFTPSCQRSGTEWEYIIDAAKKNITDERIKSAENSQVSTSHVPNRVKVVTKDDFLRSTFPADKHRDIQAECIEKFSLNKEQERAFRIISNHARSLGSDQLKMYLGGMGGTGKSQVLKAIIYFFKEHKEPHRFVVVAPTGTAAALIEGSTYHSMFGISDRGKAQPINTIKQKLKGVEYIFLDEVSMLSAKDLERIDKQLKKINNNKDCAFGGMNMVFAGDFAQLPPAFGGEKTSLYSRAIGATATDEVSQAEAAGKALWHQVTTVVILRQNMRQSKQSASDTQLRTLLENIRYKSCTPNDLLFAQSLISSNGQNVPNINKDEFRNASIITGTNRNKDEINRLGTIRFAEETGQSLTHFFSQDSEIVSAREGKRIRTFAKINPDIQQHLWDQAPSYTDNHVPGKISLCNGLPVMIRYNYATELSMTKGQEAFVSGWQSHLGHNGENILDTLFVRLKDPPSNVQIDGLPQNVVPLYPLTADVACTMPNGKKYTIQRKQVHVLPNFAMTDYASQGKTRKYNPVDLLSLRSHQGYYTALSRSSTAQGTLILKGFDINHMTGGCSGSLRQEFRELELLDAITVLQYDDKLPDSIRGETRNRLIKTYRAYKGDHFVPSGVHKAIRWNKRNPFLEPVILTTHRNNDEKKNMQDTERTDLNTHTIPQNGKRRRSGISLPTTPDGATLRKKRNIRKSSPRMEPGLVWQNNSCAQITNIAKKAAATNGSEDDDDDDDDDSLPYSIAIGLHPVKTLTLREHKIGREFRMIIFGRVLPSSIASEYQDYPANIGRFYNEGKVHYVFQLGLPLNASDVMKKAYRYQMGEIRVMLGNIWLSTYSSDLVLSNTSEGTLPFDVISPPVYNITPTQNLGPVVFDKRDPVSVHNHPIFPQDRVFDLDQNRRPNSDAVELLNGNAVALFEGTLKKVRFFANEIRIIAQERHMPSKPI
ncbi:hypothetical protein CVT24_002813, partial [Panaeolus cyanescens]